MSPAGVSRAQVGLPFAALSPFSLVDHPAVRAKMGSNWMPVCPLSFWHREPLSRRPMCKGITSAPMPRSFCRSVGHSDYLEKCTQCSASDSSDTPNGWKTVAIVPNPKRYVVSGSAAGPRQGTGHFGYNGPR